MERTKNLVKSALQKTNAHGLARLVNERQVYARILWLLAWLACCGAFLKQFSGFINKLKDNEVTSSIQSSAVSFAFPDLHFCYDNPLSGSMHLAMNDSAIKVINSTFRMAANAIEELCTKLTISECNYTNDYDLPMITVNSLPYSFLVNQLGHTMRQSILNASIVRTCGMAYQYQALNISEFYHPNRMRCFRVTLNETQRQELQSSGPNKWLYFLLMIDAPDSRMGRAALPSVDTPYGSMSAPYWALDKQTMFWPDSWSAVRLFISETGHYPSRYDTSVSLEAGRSYNVKLKMSEIIHKEDPSRCVSEHPDVQIVNPYDNSAYTVKYDYAYCCYSAEQAQLKRELNVTSAFLPHPWPPAGRSLYNLSSGWGSLQDVRTYLAGKERLKQEEIEKLCDTARMCSERTYTAAVDSVQWPTRDSLRNFLRDLDYTYPKEIEPFPSLDYLRLLNGNPNSTELAAEFVRANVLQLLLTVDSTKADRTIFSRSYSFESFVADVGGVLGVYLGMSVLTACEILQFLHDLVLNCFWSRSSQESSANDEEQHKTANQSPINFETKELPL